MTSKAICLFRFVAILGYGTQNRTFEMKKQNASEPKRLPLIPINGQVYEQASNEQSLRTGKETGNATKTPSIRAKLLQLHILEKSNQNRIAHQAIKQINHQLTSAFSKSPLQLTNLNPDCLQLICDKLNFQDLINLAGTCVHLRSTVCSIFESHTKDHELILYCENYPRFILKMRTNSWPHEFHGMDFAAFMFRFSDVIKRLTIINMFPLNGDKMRFENDTRIEGLIAKAFGNEDGQSYELKFIRCGMRMMDGISLDYQNASVTPSPFEHIKKVIFERCTVGSSALNWPTIFPRIQKLSIIDCDVSMARECIEKSFHQLKCFDLKVSYLNENSWFDSSFTIANVKRAFDENPNIEKLMLSYWNDSVYDAKLLEYAAEHLPHLYSLHLWHLRYTDFGSEGPINFPYVRKLTLSNDFQNRFGDNLASLSFHALQTFYLLGQYNSECVAFLGRHQTIEKFVCHASHGRHMQCPTDSDLQVFGNILPRLKTLCVSGNGLTPGGLIEFISGCATVSFIKVRNVVFSHSIRDRFEKDCKERGWKVSYNQMDNAPKIIMKKA